MRQTEAIPEPADANGVKKARAEEMAVFDQYEVCTKVPEQEAWDVTGKSPIGVRWIDINKGDTQNWEYRSRLVAKEIKRDKRDVMFAATPPLEAKKAPFSLAVTEEFGSTKHSGGRRRGKGPRKLLFIDVKRAYFQASAKRPVYVQLPPEDASPGQCGRLNKSMYGTRDAAQNWEA